MTAIPQPEPMSPSRRAVLAGALGGIGALAATVIGRASPVQATHGEVVTVGHGFLATSMTTISNVANDASVLGGQSHAGGVGVLGSSISSTGVRGSSTTYLGVSGSSEFDIGVHGESLANNQAGTVGHALGNGTGVLGASGGAAEPAARAKTGVYGYANQDIFSSGVTGQSPLGVGVRGQTTSGYAGYFEGRVYTNAWYELGEVATPAAPIANRARLFVRDNGAGKTQLCVRFNTGTVRVLTTQP